MHYPMMDDYDDRVENKSHAIRGQKQEHGGSFGQNTPGGCGNAHVERSHAEIESLKKAPLSLAGGVPFRVGMGRMDESIDDGRSY